MPSTLSFATVCDTVFVWDIFGTFAEENKVTIILDLFEANFGHQFTGGMNSVKCINFTDGICTSCRYK